MMRTSDPNKRTINTPSRTLTKDEAISVAAKLMSNSMPTISLVNAKLFFSFNVATDSWTFSKRKGLAALLNAITKKTEEDTFGCWLTKDHPSPQESEWSFPPLGPRQPVWVGAVHVESGHYIWHSVMDCRIRISEEPLNLNSPVYINVTTTW